MHLRLRFIGKALEYLNAKGYDDRRLSLQVSPEFLQVGDLIRHPLFPGRSVYVVAREMDLVDRCINAWIDELPGSSVHPEDAQEPIRIAAAEPGDAAFPVGLRAVADR
jgi:hypothetical protein